MKYTRNNCIALFYNYHLLEVGIDRNILSSELHESAMWFTKSTTKQSKTAFCAAFMVYPVDQDYNFDGK